MLLELREMQKVAYERVMDENTEDKDCAQLLRAYVTAEQQRNVLRMRPAPKPVDVQDLQRQREKAKRARGEQVATWKRKPAAQVQVVPMPDATASVPSEAQGNAN